VVVGGGGRCLTIILGTEPAKPWKLLDAYWLLWQGSMPFNRGGTKYISIRTFYHNEYGSLEGSEVNSNKRPSQQPSPSVSKL